MKLVKLKAKNIFSLGEIELNLQNRGLVLVTGYSHDEGGFNGSGKSSLTSKAILWVLYGGNLTGIKVDEVINRHVDKSELSYGVLNIIDNKNKELIISRHRNPVLLTVHYDGVDVTGKTINGSQQIINNIIGYSFDEFIRTSFFGQGLTEVFLSASLSFQKQLIEKILPFEKIDELAKDTKNIINKYDTAYKRLGIEEQILKKEIESTVKDIEILNSRKFYEIQQQQKDQASLLNLPGASTSEELKNEIANYKNALAFIEHNIDNINKQLEDSSRCKECNQIIPNPKHNLSGDVYEVLKQFYNKIQHINRDIAARELKLKVLEQFNKYVNTTYFDEMINEKNNDKEIKDRKLLSVKKEIEEIYTSLSGLEFWEKQIKGPVRTNLLAMACPILTDNTNFFLEKLKNPQIKIKFYCDNNTFYHTLESKTGGASFESLSGGEQQMVNFAVGLSLRSLTSFVRSDNFVPSLLILDEPFTMLDRRNAEAIIEFLTTTNIAETIFLVSNDPELMALIPNVIKVVKRNGISVLEN